VISDIKLHGEPPLLVARSVLRRPINREASTPSHALARANSRSPMPTARTPGAIHDPQRSWAPRSHAAKRTACVVGSREPRRLAQAFARSARPADRNPRHDRCCTNNRSSTADELVRLVPPRKMSLDQALEFLRETSAST
jgi:hypothetical protein